ncbi:hypothetical protein Mapa_011050 [Marchantia paleacea]|nr:hypothetical protein Mapa_011050 [Marchantia paleacea]
MRFIRFYGDDGSRTTRVQVVQCIVGGFKSRDKSLLLTDNQPRKYNQKAVEAKIGLGITWQEDVSISAQDIEVGLSMNFSCQSYGIWLC